MLIHYQFLGVCWSIADIFANVLDLITSNWLTCLQKSTHLKNGLIIQIHFFHVQYKVEENVNSLPVSWSLLKYRRHFWQRSWPYQLQLSDMPKKTTQIIKDWIYNSDSLVTFTVLNGRKCLSFTMLLEFAEVSKTLLTTFLSFPAPID